MHNTLEEIFPLSTNVLQMLNSTVLLYKTKQGTLALIDMMMYLSSTLLVWTNPEACLISADLFSFVSCATPPQLSSSLRDLGITFDSLHGWLATELCSLDNSLERKQNSPRKRSLNIRMRSDSRKTVCQQGVLRGTTSEKAAEDSSFDEFLNTRL